MSSGTTVAMFGVFRHQRNGFVDDEARHRMQVFAAAGQVDPAWPQMLEPLT
jgi:hypothetical protein